MYGKTASRFFWMVSALSINIIHLIKPGRPRDVFRENHVKVSLMGVLLKEPIVEAGEGYLNSW